MAWVRTDDGAPEHLKVREAGSHGYALWHGALSWCNRNLTDGRVPKAMVPDTWRPVGERFNYRAVTARLLAKKLWHLPGETCTSEMCPAHPKHAERLDPVEDAYIVHDYFEYQKSKAEVLADREKSNQRVKKHRNRKLFNDDAADEHRADSGDEEPREDDGYTECNGVTPSAGNAVGNGTPVPVPDPILKPSFFIGVTELTGPVELRQYFRSKGGWCPVEAMVHAAGNAEPFRVQHADAALADMALRRVDLQSPGAWMYFLRVLASLQRGEHWTQHQQRRAPRLTPRKAPRRRLVEPSGVKPPVDEVAPPLPTLAQREESWEAGRGIVRAVISGGVVDLEDGPS